MSISTTKRFLAAFIAIVFTVATAKAQAPQKMSFQSVVRNSSGVLVTNHSAEVEYPARFYYRHSRVCRNPNSHL